jgi:glycosyltransferase involved in cell wall biosynthesis
VLNLITNVNSKFKILHIIDSLDIGGAERIASDLGNLFAEKGHHVSVLLIHGKKAGAFRLNQNIEVLELNRKFKFNPFKMFWLYKEARKHDILHIHGRHNLRYVGLINFFLPLKAKIVLHDHSSETGNLSLSLRFFLSKYSYIGVSEEVSNWLQTSLNIKPKKVFILKNTTTRKEFQTRANPDNSYYRLIIVSNFRAVKNISFAVELLYLLNSYAKNKLFKLDIVGNISEADYYSQISKQIKEKNLENFVNIISNCHDVQSILYQYDLAIHTSTSESGPLVLIEYIAQGLPFLSYLTGSVVRQIIQTYPEFVINSFDHTIWLERINKLICSKSHYSESLINTYEQLFSTQSYFEKCLSIYKQITENY